MASVETLGALERRLVARIPQQQMRGEIEARLKHIGRTAKVHGFRPGKAPYRILEQQYGAQVHQEVLGESLQRAFAEQVKANNLKVAGSPSFEIKSADPAAEQVEFSATFEVFPDVEVGDLGAETVERTVFVLSDADVENTLETVRKQRAVFEAVERAAQAGDQVRIDFAGKIGGEPFVGGDAKDTEVVLGEKRMLQDFESAIIGMRAGATKSFRLTFPDDYQGKDVAGKEAEFTVSLHEVGEPKLPALDAEFAKSLGIADGDVEKLKAEIRANLEREAASRIKARNKESAMQALLKVCKLDVPKVLVEQEAHYLAHQMSQDMARRGVNIPKGMDLPIDMFRERAERRVKLGLILSSLVEKQDLKAKPDQVRAALQDYAQTYSQPEQVMRWYTSDPARMRDMENMAVENNVTAWVMNTARVEDKTIGFDELMGNAQ